MLDKIDRRIIKALAANARVSLKNLSNEVHLSPPSVSARLRRLEERGVIRAYTIDIDPRALGFQLQAIVRIRAMPGRLHFVEEQLKAIAEISECDKITGEDCFIARMSVRTIEQLDEILDRIGDKAQTHTSLVKSQTIPRRLPLLVAGDEPAMRTARSGRAGPRRGSSGASGA